MTPLTLYRTVYHIHVSGLPRNLSIHFDIVRGRGFGLGSLADLTDTAVLGIRGRGRSAGINRVVGPGENGLGGHRGRAGDFNVGEATGSATLLTGSRRHQTGPIK